MPSTSLDGYAPAQRGPVMQRLIARARELFPTWDEPALIRWAQARVYSETCTPHFASLIPVTHEQLHAQQYVWNEAQFIPRTRREAGIA